MNEGLSAADVMALSNREDNMWNNPFVYLVWLWAFSAFGGGFGNNGLNSALTRSDLFDGFNKQEINGQLRGITQGLCDGVYSLNNSTMQGFNSVNNAICSLGYQTQGHINEIASVVHAEGEATRALINANTMQELRDRLEARDRDILARDFQLSQQAQSAALVNELRPCAKPAYITCSPYTTSYGCGFGSCAC